MSLYTFYKLANLSYWKFEFSFKKREKNNVGQSGHNWAQPGTLYPHSIAQPNLKFSPIKKNKINK